MCGSGGGRCEVTSAFPGGGARRPGPERQLGVLRPPAFGLWPEARPRVFPGWEMAPGGPQVGLSPCAGAVGGVCGDFGSFARRGAAPTRQLGVLRPPGFGLWPEARPRVAGRRTEGVFEVSQNDSYTWGAKGLPAGSPKGSMQTPLAFPALQTDGACCGRCHRQDADPSEISWCSVSRQNSAGNSNCRSMTLGSVLRREL